MDHEIFGILDSPEQEGYIRMRKPSVFIFPGGKGDSAFFCVDDYTVLVNGGSLNRPWFWRLIRHHCRLDCMISTHLGTDSLVGLNSLFTRKVEEKNLKLPECENDDYKRLLRHLISPEMGLFFVNFPKHLSVEDTRSQEEVQVVQETMKLTKKLNMLVRPLVSKTSMEPITLFMKAGIGKLDLYPLLPEHGNKGLAHIYDKYGATDKFSVDDRMMSDLASICCLLVWHPESANDNIIRVLFPGNAKQDAILEAFERVKQLDFLRHPQPTPASLKELKKKAAAASKPSSATGAAMKRTNNARNISSAPAGATRNTKTTTTTTSRKPAPRPNTATSRVGLHNKQQRPGTVPSSTTNKKTETTTTTSNKPTSKSATTARQRTTTKPTTARPASARPATTTTKPTTTNGAAKKEPATKTTTSTNMRGAKKAAAPAAAKSSAAPALSKTQATSKKAPATTASRGAKPATTTTAKKTTTTTMSKSKTAANAAAAAAKAKKTDAEKAAAPIKKKPAPVVAPVEKKLPVAPVEEKMLQKRPSPEGEDGDREKVFIEATAAAVKKPLSPVIGVGKPHDDDKQTKQPASCGDYLSLDAAVDEPAATKQAPIGGETTTITTQQPDVVCKELAVEPDVVAEPNVAKQEPDVITQVPDYKKDEPTTQAVTPDKTPAAAPVMVTEEPDLLKEKPDVVASEPDVVQQQQQQDIVVDKAQQQQISTYVDDIGDGLMNTPPPSMDSISKSTTTGGATSSEKIMVFGNDDTVIDTDDLLTPQDKENNFLMLNYAFDAAMKQQQIIMDEDGMPETPITTTTTNKPADLVLTTTTSQQQMTSQADLPPSPLNPDAVPFVPISPTNSIHQSSSSSSLVTPNDHVIIDDPFTMTSPSEGEKKMAVNAPRLDLTGSDERLGLGVGESPMSVCGSSLATTTDVTSPVHPQQQQPSSVASSPLVVNASYARDVTMMMTSGGSAAFASEHDFKFDDGLVDDDGKMGRMSTSSSATLSRGGEDTGSSAQVVARIDSPHTATDDSAFTSYMMSSLSANFTNDETISQPPSTTQLSTAAGGDPHMHTTDDNGNHHHHTMTSSHQQQAEEEMRAETAPQVATTIISPPHKLDNCTDDDATPPIGQHNDDDEEDYGIGSESWRRDDDDVIMATTPTTTTDDNNDHVMTTASPLGGQQHQIYEDMMMSPLIPRHSDDVDSSDDDVIIETGDPSKMMLTSQQLDTTTSSSVFDAADVTLLNDNMMDCDVTMVAATAHLLDDITIPPVVTSSSMKDVVSGNSVITTGSCFHVFESSITTSTNTDDVSTVSHHDTTKDAFSVDVSHHDTTEDAFGVSHHGTTEDAFSVDDFHHGPTKDAFGVSHHGTTKDAFSVDVVSHHGPTKDAFSVVSHNVTPEDVCTVSHHDTTEDAFSVVSHHVTPEDAFGVSHHGTTEDAFSVDVYHHGPTKDAFSVDVVSHHGPTKDAFSVVSHNVTPEDAFAVSHHVPTKDAFSIDVSHHGTTEDVSHHDDDDKVPTSHYLDDCNPPHFDDDDDEGATRKQQDSPVYDVDRYGAAILRFTDDMLLAQHRCNYTSSVEGDKQQRKFTSPPDDISAVFGVPPHYNDSDVSPTAPLAPADLMDVTDDDQISSPEGANMMMGQQQSNNNSTTTMDNNSTRMDNNSTTTAIMDNNPFLLDFSSNATPDPAFVLKPNQADPQMPAVTTSNRTPGMKKKPTSSSASGDKKSSTSSLVNYIDFTYVPHHAHPDYVGKNFFAKVRSRYYVLSGMEDEGSTQVLDGLLQGVKSWKDENSRNVTVIPTHDSESLARWFQTNYDELQSTNIHMVASNCKVVMHNETIEACKIEF